MIISSFGGIIGSDSAIAGSGVIGLKLLWTNSSPDDEFKYRTITIPELIQYQVIAIEFRNPNNPIGALQYFFRTDSSGDSRAYQSVVMTDGDSIITRLIAFRNNNVDIYFGDVYGAPDRGIPIKIYGVKGITITR